MSSSRSGRQTRRRRPCSSRSSVSASVVHPSSRARRIAAATSVASRRRTSSADGLSVCSSEPSTATAGPTVGADRCGASAS
ncbi:hypothetical protein [Ornithinimicrobium kibberense]|uniref:hypothetical protein n=1 Tax=Ornithinimicrobium kibberense TaxID=282060 RepID=UPI003616673F